MSVARLEDVSEFVLDGTHASPVRTETGVPVLSAQNVKDGVLDFKTDRYTSEEEYRTFKSRLALREGDLLLTIVGTIGRSAVVSAVRPLVFQRSVAIIRPKAGVVDPRFFFHASRSQRFQAQLASSANQSSQAGVYLGKLKKVEIPLPPLADQRRIAEVLDRAEELRAKRRAALSQLDTLTQSIFFDLLREAGQSVATVSIEDGMEAIIDYRGKSPTKTAVGVPLVTARVVKGGELLEPNEFIAEKDYDAWMRRGFPNPGDVLFTTEAPLGEVAQLDGRKVALAQRLLVLRGKPSLLDNTFLKHALTAQEVKKQIDARATGSTVRGIRQRELRKVMIPVPPFALQRDFARRVTAVEKLRAAHRASLAELNALFAMLQDRAFRGEL